MNPTLKWIVETATDAGSLAKSLRESGLAFVQGKAGGLPFAGSLFGIASDETEFDERHYVLVPLPSGAGRFAVYAKRVLPSAEQPMARSLETKRVFHVPDLATVPALEGRLLDRAVREGARVFGSELADGLERIADEVDQSIERVSGGVLVVASAVCAFNPVLGLGIALPGFLGIVGGKGAKIGIGKLGERTRRRQHESDRRRLEKTARKEAAQAKTETVVSPLLRALAKLLSDLGEGYDPFLDETTWADRSESQRQFRIAAEAICEIQAQSGTFTGPAEAWIRHLGELRGQWEPPCGSS